MEKIGAYSRRTLERGEKTRQPAPGMENEDGRTLPEEELRDSGEEELEGLEDDSSNDEDDNDEDPQIETYAWQFGSENDVIEPPDES